MDDSSRPTAFMQLLRDMAHDKRPGRLSYRSTLQTSSSSASAPLKRNYFPLPSLPSFSSVPEPARRAFHHAMEHPFISSSEKRPNVATASGDADPISIADDEEYDLRPIESTESPAASKKSRQNEDDLLNFQNHNSERNFGNTSTHVFTAFVSDGLNENIQESACGGSSEPVMSLSARSGAAQIDLAVKLSESKDHRIDQLKTLHQVEASIPGQIEVGIRNFMNRHAANRQVEIDADENLPPPNDQPEEPRQNDHPPAQVLNVPVQVPPIPGVNEGVYPFVERDLDEMSQNNPSVNAFISALMHKLFTEEYLATKTVTKMENAHRMAIIGAVMKRYRTVKRRNIEKIEEVNESHVRRVLTNVFSAHRPNRKKKQQQVAAAAAVAH